MGFSSPSLNAKPKLPSKCTAFKNKLRAYTTALNTMKTTSNGPLMDMLSTKAKFPNSTSL
jgi:hypothetical protein